MSSLTITTILEARAAANEWLISHLPDRFTSGIPKYDGSLFGWRVPVWLSYPGLESFGPLGEVVVDQSGTVVTHTPPEEIRDRATKLYEEHREQIEAPLL